MERCLHVLEMAGSQIQDGQKAEDQHRPQKASLRFRPNGGEERAKESERSQGEIGFIKNSADDVALNLHHDIVNGEKGENRKYGEHESEIKYQRVIRVTWQTSRVAAID